MPIDFADIVVEAPTRDGLAERYRTIEATFDEGTPEARAAALDDWDRLRRELGSWESMVRLKFQQNTQDAQARADRDYADAMLPAATGFESAFKRRLLNDPDRAGLAAMLGSHALRLWETDVTTFDPVIEADLETEAKLAARYVELMASARISIGGIEVNFAGIEPYAQDLDRDVRHEAESKRWAFFAEHGEELDRIFDELVKLRHGMARKLGFASFTELGYRRKRRVDYGPAEVASYRDEVVQHVVPLVAELIEERRHAFGYDRLYYWDEAVIDRHGNPKPAGGHDYLVAQAEPMFDRMDSRLGAFYRVMRDGGFMDLTNRPSKAGGGFCTTFPAEGVPFIFANFNGTDHDIRVFTHEMGHAFQKWQSRPLKGVDSGFPTSESAEIHSMSLEFLSHPHMALMVGEAEAERARRVHLIQRLSFLPYGVCVDHFQHLVYANPDAAPAERHEMWRTLEQRYMPWTDYGDLAYPAKGGLWQAKRHIYKVPFYYIDYTLASCCAMQFWLKSLADYPAAMAEYVALCGRGGSAPFQELVRSAGLASPFAPGALAGIVTEAVPRLMA